MDFKFLIKKDKAYITSLSIFLVLMWLLSGCYSGEGADILNPVDESGPPYSGAVINPPTHHCESVDIDMEKEPEVVTVTITATGDCTLGINSKMVYPESFDAYYDDYGPSYFFQNVRDILGEDDFTIVNLEGPLTTSNDEQTKIHNHKGKPEYVDILREGSVEAVSLSNNHTFDYGISGYEDTVNALDQAGITWAGDDSYGLFEAKGVKIGFVSVDEHYNGPLVEVRLKAGVEELRRQAADIAIACIHWGRAEDENTSRVDDYQVELGKKCIDWGYDLIIGNHPHALQGIDRYRGKYITYCLGNFCYGGNKNLKDGDSGIFRQVFTLVDGELQTDDNVQFIPCSSSSVADVNDYRPTIASGAEGHRIITKMNAYSAQYGVVFDLGGCITTKSLSDGDRSDAYYSIFLESIREDALGDDIEYVAIDISSLDLSDSSYLMGLFEIWAKESDVKVFLGTKEQIVEAGYHNYAGAGTGRVFIFSSPKWSNLQVTCSLSRLVTMLNYMRDDYTAAYANEDWVAQKGGYIQK
ncbi:MAG TPA: CapA family protein [Clostridia bacterium]|nr:CapA family protein [Clostridia bacterium]